MQRVASCLFVLAALTLARECSAEWRAGVARAKITPRQPMWMSGYASRDHAAEGTLIDLWAKALVLDDGRGERALLISLDLVGIDRGFSLAVCEALRKQHGFERRQIALCVSHTHSGPVVATTLKPMFFLNDAERLRIDEYTSELQGQLVALAGEALANLQPARLASGNGFSSIAVNRRNNREPDVPRLREAGLLQGPVDHDVPVLAIRTSEDKPLAIVFGYACHATVLSGYQWSGDYPGYAQLEIEKLYPGATALFFAGCGGDQNPLPRRQVALAEQYGQSLARSVDDVLRGPMTAVEDRLATYYDEVPLAFAPLPSRADLEQQSQSQDKYVASRGKALLAQVDAGQPLSASYPYPAQLWTLGRALRWVILGGEVTVDYSLRLKRELGRERTWVAAYSNDVLAYIPSLRVLREGGYEGGGAMVYYGRPAPWSPAVEETIVAGVHGLVEAHAQAAAKVDHSRLSDFIDDDGRERAVRTPEDWRRRRAQILQGMQLAMGSLPSRTGVPPLDMQILDTQTGDGYTRQKISYIAEDTDRVTAYLYLSTGAGSDARRAAVVALHPTGTNGKAIVDAQGPSANRGYAKELAQRGYVVLAPDYPSFGDLKDYDFAGDRYVSGTMKGIVNHMRGIDLLASRDDVDPERIAAIGHSLGGHNAMFLGAFDERVKVVVSSCGWTPFHDYYEGKIAGWTSERYMPRLKHVYGLDPSRVPFDFYEIVAALAPRAFFSVSPERDANFAVAGVRKAIPVAGQVYELLGAADRLQVRYPDCEHDFPDASRREAYRFIDKMLQHQPAREIP